MTLLARLCIRYLTWLYRLRYDHYAAIFRAQGIDPDEAHMMAADLARKTVGWEP